jgi:hypothetical protein
MLGLVIFFVPFLFVLPFLSSESKSAAHQVKRSIQMDRDELEALMAIYGEELAEVREDGTVAVIARSTNELREAVLLLTVPAGYPAELPEIHVEGCVLFVVCFCFSWFCFQDIEE